LLRNTKLERNAVVESTIVFENRSYNIDKD